jgi:uncharacterized protein
MATVSTATVRPQARHAAAPKVSLWRTPRTRALLAVGTITLAGAVVALAAHVYTDLLWFRELGQERVLWTTLLWRVLTPAAAGLGTACVLQLNLGLAVRGRAGPATRPRVAALWRLHGLLCPLAAVAGGVVSVKLLSPDAWKLALVWTHRGDFGATDPLFHRDAGFFVFSLPLYRVLAAWLLHTLVMTAAAAGAVYAASGDRRGARRHLLVLAAVILAALAWRVRLGEYGFALPHDGSVVPGASYTDVHVRLPLLRVREFLILAGAGVCLYGALRPVRPAPLLAVGLAGLVAVFGLGGLPSLVERFAVEPQALARERPYVADAIAATRRALALDRIDVRPVSAGGRLTARDLTRNRATIDNVPVWDPGMLRAAMNELQSIGAYYHFPRATVDRYDVGGVMRLMTVAPRELDLARLPRASRSWANERFAYTHGHGAVAALTSQADGNGYPRFAERAFGAAHNPLGIGQPRTYYGAGTTSSPPYVIANSRRGEVEQPQPGADPPTYHYDGTGGISLANPLRRAAFAARFGDLRLLLTETLTGGSRIMLHRNAGDRVRTLAPFLRWDERPDTVVAGGRVWFLLHGYSTSADYPYAARVLMGGADVSYVRGSAVAAVDAFSGAVRLYDADPEDPLLAAWRRAYPGLFLPLEQMSPELRAHLRYPRELFEAQAAAYATYHASDPTAFWNGADAWRRAQELAGSIEHAAGLRFPESHERLDEDERRDGHIPRDPSGQRPGYELVRLPGDRSERFALTTSFTPRGRQNLVGYLAGSVDPSGRPQLALLSLPRDRLTVGPSQATRQIIASRAVTRRLELLNRESRDLGKSSVGRTVLGRARLVPIGRTLVHIQPVYVTAGGNSLPRLQLVTAYADGRIGYGRDVRSALRRLLG